jgi:MHS family citrate/tricarballylate:H+ symporter-like MFS transporter
MRMAELTMNRIAEPREAGAPVRHVVAAVIGNALECYDFIVYAYFAVQIGHAFFPAHTAFASLMLTLATFGAGFVSRPLGALVIGRMGDRAGRKPAMLLSFGLMGLSMLAMAFMPTFAMIGVAAPLLVLAARLLQGFAIGGDIGSTTTFLMEAAPTDRRGLYTAWQLATQGGATLVSGLLGAALTHMLTPQALQDWGWRAAFLLGAVVLPFGLYLRRSLPETLEPAVARPAGPGSANPLAGYGRTIALAFLIIGNINVAFYVLSYLTTYAVTVLRMPPASAFAAPIAFGVCNIVFSLVGGAASDRFGRKPVMIWPRVALLLATYPAFFLLARNRDAASLLLATGALALLSQLGAGGALIAVTESLPKEARCLALSAIYASAGALFGGVTQPALAWLLHSTGDVLAPAYYLMASTAISLVAMALLRETAPRRRGL